MKINNITFRSANNSDCEQVKALVSKVLEEYNLIPEPFGTDVDLSDLEKNYFERGGIFEVLENENGEILGSVGLFPIDETTIELRKMYFSKELRGKGFGTITLKRMIETSKSLGFSKIYLETASVLVEAIGLYEKFGFVATCEGMHTKRCDKAYVLEVSAIF
jgi:N-acetylglutamate synthase-like GNAT family acetyltransferase